MAITNYQIERIQDIRSWYAQIYQTLEENIPISIRYLSLWAVFNSIYNLADYPKVKLKGVSINDGRIIPSIRGRDDDKKLRFIARQLSIDLVFVKDFIQTHFEIIEALANRTPEVNQPTGTETIVFEFDSKKFGINLAELHGIASIDNRITQNDGTVLFQYRYLDLDLSKENVPNEPYKFFLQLLLVLYQLRNNITHGGSVAFYMNKSDLSSGAIMILNTIVQHLLSHQELLDQDMK